jgi:hypothetical protein
MIYFPIQYLKIIKNKPFYFFPILIHKIKYFITLYLKKKLNNFIQYIYIL